MTTGLPFLFLGVLEGIGDEKILLVFSLLPAITESIVLESSLLEFLHLHQVVVADLKAILLAVHQLEGLVERPPVLFDEVGY
jgi:hypothetical protein